MKEQMRACKDPEAEVSNPRGPGKGTGGEYEEVLHDLDCEHFGAAGVC